MIDMNRVDKCQAIVINGLEEKRLVSLGVMIPPYPKCGPIIHDGNKVGYADTFAGVTLTDKDFIKAMVKDALWYVNERD